MRKIPWLMLLLLGLMLMVNLTVWAEGGEPPLIKEAVIYSDGLVFLVREGRVDFENGEGVIALLPQALRGSLNVYAKDPMLRIDQVTAFQEEIERGEEPLKSGEEFFRANIGKPLQLVTADGSLTGTVKGFIEPDLLIVTITHENGIISDEVIPVGRITAYSLLEPPVLTEKVKETAGRLRIKLQSQSITGQSTIGLSYLQTGISWYPEYILNLQSETVGDLTFSAVIKNDLDDLKGATIYLAEEGPHFTREVSPLVIFAPLEKALAYPAEVTTRRIMKGQEVEFLSGTEEERLPSLRMYKKQDFNLKKGERAVIPLFRGGVRVEPIYRLELSRSSYGSEISVGSAWKGYRIYNDSPTTHWPAGKIMINMENKSLSLSVPLSLRSLPSIPPQSSGEIRVLTDTDIETGVTEEEFERIQGALTFQERDYSSVRVTGEIRLINHKSEDIKIKVTYLVPGEVNQASDGATITKKALRLTGPNPQTEVAWEVTLPARGLTKLSYVYQTYVPMAAGIMK